MQVELDGGEIGEPWCGIDKVGQTTLWGDMAAGGRPAEGGTGVRRYKQYER